MLFNALIVIFLILLAFILYGIWIIIGFYLAVLLLDTAAFSWQNKWLMETVIIEWLCISAPFIFWAFKHQFWLWLTLSISFLCTQIIRLRMIKKIIHKARISTTAISNDPGN